MKNLIAAVLLALLVSFGFSACRDNAKIYEETVRTRMVDKKATLETGFE